MSATRAISPFDGAGAMRRVRADRDAVLPFRVARDAVADLPGQVQSLAVVLQDVDNPQALLVVLEAAEDQRLEHPLARRDRMACARDSWPSAIASVSSSFSRRTFGDAARDLGDLEGVRQSRPIVIAGRRKEHLGLVLQAWKALQWMTRLRSR